MLSPCAVSEQILRSKGKKMGLRLSLLLATAVIAAGAAKADTIDQYSLSVKITSTGFFEQNPFAGETFTGTFTVDEQTRDVTNFSANLLNSNPPFSASDLGNVATFDSTAN